MTKGGKPEVGDELVIEIKKEKISTIWLGKVSNGKDLTAAMKLMKGISDEKRAAKK